MPTEENVQPQDGNETPAEPENRTDTPPEGDRTFSEDYVRELREEAKGYRLKLRDLEQKFDKEREKELADQQKWQELAEKYKARLEELEPQAEQWASYKEQQKEALLEKLPDELKKKYADKSPDFVLGVVPDILKTLENPPADNPDQERSPLRRTSPNNDDLTPFERMLRGKRKGR